MHGYIISKGYRELERSFKIYCKLDGQLKKQFVFEFEFVTLCGRDRLGIQIIDVIFEILRLIKTTYIFSLDMFFQWTSLFVWTRDTICKTKNLNTNNNSVENLQGERSRLITSRYNVDTFNPECECQDRFALMKTSYRLFIAKPILFRSN
jgi:hypothetical protein